LNSEFWAIILEATEKTQKPFVKRALKMFERIRNKQEIFSIEDLCDLIIRTQAKYSELKHTMSDVFYTFGLRTEFDALDSEFHYNGQTRQFYWGRNDYDITADRLRQALFLGKTLDPDSIYQLPPFRMFDLLFSITIGVKLPEVTLPKNILLPWFQELETVARTWRRFSLCWMLNNTERACGNKEILKFCPYSILTLP